MMRLIILIMIILVSNSVISQDFRDYRLKDIDNNMILLDDIKGKELTVIDFWATWCKPCISSIPKIENLYDLYKDKGVQFMGINIDSPRNISKVKPFVNAIGISYPVLYDSNQELMTEYNVFSIPTLLIANSQGEIIYTHEGFNPGDEKELAKKLDELLEK